MNNELVKKCAELIQKVFDAEPNDGRFEKTYKMDSLFRDNVGIQFRSFFGNIETLFRLTLGERESFARAQWLIDITLQRIAIRLKELFTEQSRCRKDLESIRDIRHKIIIPKHTLRFHLGDFSRVTKEIESWKLHFRELSSSAKELGIEVLEGGEYQYDIYSVLMVDFEEILKEKLQLESK